MDDAKFFFRRCGDLGYHYLKGDGVQKDLRKAVAIYEKVCDNMIFDYCIEIGNFYRLGVGVTKDLKKAVKLYKKACDNIEKQSFNWGCVALGTICFSEELNPKGYIECKGMHEDPLNFGLFYYEKFDDIKELKKAAEFLKKACDSGDASGCWKLGSLYDENSYKKIGTDQKKSLELYIKACNGGYAYGCRDVATIYEKGEVVNRDFEKVLFFMRKACEAGIHWECKELADIYYLNESKKVDVNLKEAAFFYKKACDGNYIPACLNAGIIHLKFAVSPKDYEKIADFFRKSCDDYYDSAQGCGNLGVLYHKGLGVSKNREKAVTLLKKACEKGYKPSCDYYYKLWDDGYIP